ncbi:TonB-dependent receptor plug domain-containing protein [Microscilla marina]|uniref:TonB-dependent receptor, putative n=1 Tax=Microscilla marina ATCC 23134 TaxID=313606 RepID=A1ZC49_MICM2|nr:TonB-dependent receptor plug domain-containing protein [Microscilla marina]EAY31851.1 TonB-dependent receptor, putative [Microscilla marina ATCC 23134]
MAHKPHWWLITTFIISQSIILTSTAQTDSSHKSVFFTSSANEVMKLSKNNNNSVTTTSKKAESITEAAGIISVVTQKEIEAFGALSLVDVLDRLSSIYVLSTYAYPNNMVSIRGDNTAQYNNRVLILLDGRPMRESLFLGENRAIYSMIPLKTIDRIELLKGPGSTLYGTSAFTGAINIITKKGKEARKFDQSISYGAFQRFQTNFSGGISAKDATLSWGLNYVDDKGWDFTATDENGTTRTIQMLQKGLGGQMKIDYGNFTLQGYYGISEQAAIGNSPQFGSSINRPYDDYRSYSSRLFLDAGYDFRLSSKISNQTNITYNHYDFRFFYIEANDVSRQAGSNDVLVENTTFLNLGKKTEVILGGVANYRQGYGTQPVLNADGSGYDIFNNPVPNPNPFVFVPNSQEVFWGVYAQASYRPFSYLKIVAGGQLNKAPGTPIDIVPRLALISNFSKNFGAKLMFGQAFRSPSISERFRKSRSAYGDPTLAPETVTTIEAQIYREIPGKLLGTLTYFNSTGNRLIRRSRPSDSLLVIDGVSVAKYINEGSINTQGIELEGKRQLPYHLSLNVNASFFWEGDNTTATVTGMPNLMAKAGISYRLPRYGSLGIYHSFFGKGTDINAQQTVNPTPEAFHFLSAHLRLNLASLFKFNGLYSVFLEVYARNLLNAQVHYPEYIRRNINSIPGRAGRAFYGTLRLSF